MRDKTLEQIILMCLANYGVDEPADVLRAEVYNQKCNVTRQDVDETIRHLLECGAITQATTILGDVTYSIVKAGKDARRGC